MIGSLVIIANPDGPHQVAAAMQLAKGAKRHGISVKIIASAIGKLPAADAYACWGWKIGHAVKLRARCPVLVMERGYIGDRMTWTSLHWDGLNGRGRFHDPRDGGDRWRAIRDHLPRPQLHRPSNPREGLAVIMGQVPGDMSIEGVDIGGWYLMAAQQAAGLGLSPVFRPHPLARQRAPASLRMLADTLESVLDAAAAVYAFNSNSLTDAAMAGVPIVCGDRGAITWEIGGQGLTAAPRLDDRTEWLHRTAWRQWLPKEIECGEAWAAIRQAATEGA